MDKNYAYVTLLSSIDYLEGVMVLALSLQKVCSKYPLVVGVTKDIATEKIINPLKKIGCWVYIINTLQYNKETQNEWKNHPVLNTASKIALFELNKWDKLVYLDADILVLENIDDLFNKPDGAMLWRDNGNGGLSTCFVFMPEHHNEIKYYLSLIENIKTFDGDLLAGFWFTCKSNQEYRINEQYLCEYGKAILESFKTKAIHFGGSLTKPWMDFNDFIKDDNEIIKLYIIYLNEIKAFK